MGPERPARVQRTGAVTVQLGVHLDPGRMAGPATLGDLIQVRPGKLAEVLECVRAAIDAMGGGFTMPFTTVTVAAANQRYLTGKPRYPLLADPSFTTSTGVASAACPSGSRERHLCSGSMTSGQPQRRTALDATRAPEHYPPRSGSQSRLVCKCASGERQHHVSDDAAELLPISTE